MKNDLVVHKSNGKDIIVDSSTKTIAKVLLTREKIWDESQKSRLHSRIQLKCKKSQKAKDYAKKKICKIVNHGWVLALLLKNYLIF